MFRNYFDLGFFFLYLALNIWLGLRVARRRSKNTRDYFLAGDRLPWYAIGGSIIAANISTEHFIGMTGAAYAAGFVLAQWEWGNWFTFTVLIWVFLPYYLRGGLYTMPEFLEKRYNRTCRYLFAVCSLVLWIVAQMAVVMLAGAKALQGMFGFSQYATILCLAVLAGSYTIYGGLLSVAWTDFLQFLVLMVGGLIVALIGLNQAGGLSALMHAAPDKFRLIYPATDPDYPWFGIYTLFISVGVWYNCTNQFVVQRCLGARSEWDGRMGVVFAGFIKIVLPLLVVIPGVVAYRLFPGLPDPDQAYPLLVKRFVPVGLGGIVMAGIASSLMSHLSSVLNSSSTVFTMDLYKPLLRRQHSEEALVRVGRWSAFVILLLATLLALWFTQGQHRIFTLIQNIGAWVAAPIAVVFLLGVLWRRATAAAATFVLVFGFPYTWLVEYVLFKRVSWLMPFDNWLNRTFLVWATCLVLMILVSFVTRPPDPKAIESIVWTRAKARLPESVMARTRAFGRMFAALDVLEGKVIGDCYKRHRHQEFLKFMRRIDDELPRVITPRDVDPVPATSGYAPAGGKPWRAPNRQAAADTILRQLRSICLPAAYSLAADTASNYSLTLGDYEQGRTAAVTSLADSSIIRNTAGCLVPAMPG